MFNFRRLFSRVVTYTEHLIDLLPGHISDANLKSAIYWVDMAETKFTSGAGTAKRNYVVERLMEKGFSEQKARLAVELALFLIARGKD